MKKIILALATLLLTVTASAGTSDIGSADVNNRKYEYDDSEVIRKTLNRFELCDIKDLKEDYDTFLNLVDLLDIQKEKKRKPTVKITDASSYSISIQDSLSGMNCDLMTDPYDGRCSYATCYKLKKQSLVK
ncbi:MAG: hypothetical protein A2622_07870 [Bdellovibrionales bacterium RIFCSPHIGHO2_01_FULL_40_29]|nr:MAG: hypothetical protein A2622_07870 [Bdellovibrionales bacterium RIFCSPHIGHO2_01_FULL_40_29]OFZ33723.1 MAG: hypothetical protein A3D17_09960 [Bdellovibrionales bacterium RIFCSPHIGHO2_02_FULL_40_15]